VGTRAVVIGASMAGLAAARVLSEHVDHVDIFERDQLPETADVRPGVPQARHAHALLGAGDQLLTRWFPGIHEQLVAGGAAEVGGEEVWWYEGGGFKVRSSWGTKAVVSSRPFLEHTVRQRVGALSAVDIHSGSVVRELLIDNDRVAGVMIDGQPQLADLVVDCSGRNTKMLDQLTTAGFPAPRVVQVKVDLAYRSRVLRRGPADFDGRSAQISPGFPDQPRAAILLPMEGERWILTLAAMHGDAAPNDDEAFRGFARSLPSLLVADVLEGAEVLSPIMTYRLPSSQWRHFEKLERWPAGYLALGDAVCSFNPIYGQGMSSAALQARALGIVLARVGLSSPLLAREHYQKAARVVADPWMLAVGADFRHPSTTGPKPAGTDLFNRYLAKVHLASHVSPAVNRQLMQVQNLLAPWTSLLRPAMVGQVLLAARRSPVSRGGTSPTPRYMVSLVPQRD